MAPTCEPSPTCSGLVPPCVPVGAEPCDNTSEIDVSKLTRLALKPVVFTLARLLPVTLMSWELLVSPVRLVLSELVKLIGYSLEERHKPKAKSH